MRLRDLVLDANLLTLLVVGLADQALLGRHQRVRSYDFDAFRLLLALLSPIRRVIVTPGVLAEASNLLRYADPAVRIRTMGVLRTLVLGEPSLGQPIPLAETHLPAVKVVLRPELLPLGLTDAGLLEAVDKNSMLLTDDWDLHNAALKAGVMSKHFTQLRAASGLL